MLLVSLTLLWLQWIITGCEAIKCYTPNGDDRNAQFGYSEGEDYAPCNAAATHSMCCAIGPVRVSSGSADSCTETGLCKNGDIVWRESCTDPTWQDPACLKLFVNGTGYGSDPVVYVDNQILTDVTVTICDNGSYCYGTGNRECCQLGQGVFLNANGQQTSVNPSASTSLTSSSSTSTTSATSSSMSVTSASGNPSSSSISSSSTAISNAQVSESNDSGGLSTGAKAGIGAGIGVAALAAILLAGFCLLKRRKKRQMENSIVQQAQYYSETKPRPVGPELQASGHGRDYQGPYATAELESPPPIGKKYGSTQGSSTVVEMS